MRLYDTASRRVRALEPAGDEVALYVCGITPYDAAHLGHAFTYHVFDVVTRRLLASGRRVRSIRNVTDCDDDIFRAARQRGVDHRALVAEQLALFDAEMASIGLLAVTAAPRVSAHVPAMVDWIRRLEEAGVAYARQGWVYFEAARFADFGRLSGLGREQMLALSRERGADPDDPRKRDPLDFVLWQPSQDDELRFDNPWGAPGRPGWHIECTVLAAEHCPQGIDLHGGGDDLVYPHHESEIAQAEALGDIPFARHWMHVGMVQLDGVKMSKSLGNLVFVHELLREAPPAAVRLMLAAHHYRAAWSYHPAELEEARQRLHTWGAALRQGLGLDPAAAAALEDGVLACLDDDLDTPGALRRLDDAIRGARRGDGGPVPLSTLLPRLAAILGAEDLGEG